MAARLMGAGPPRCRSGRPGSAEVGLLMLVLLPCLSLPRWLFRYILAFLRDGLLPEDRRLLVQVSQSPTSAQL